MGVDGFLIFQKRREWFDILVRGQQIAQLFTEFLGMTKIVLSVAEVAMAFTEVPAPIAIRPQRFGGIHRNKSLSIIEAE